MKYQPSENEARICEIFSSLQGEGTHLGEKHLFIRFEECHMHCDELGKPAETMHLDDVLAKVARLEETQGPHAFISLTGGEPLLYLPFLKPLMVALKKRGHRIHLETSGVLWKALLEVIGWCDCIAMDMKTPSVTKQENYDQDHRKFIKAAVGKELFVKIVVSKEINENEFMRQIEIVAEIAPHIPVLLTPISGDIEGHEDPELMRLIEKLQHEAMEKVRDVRIVPRFHKILNIR